MEHIIEVKSLTKKFGSNLKYEITVRMHRLLRSPHTYIQLTL
jgi:hypothetical protein